MKALINLGREGSVEFQIPSHGNKSTKITLSAKIGKLVISYGKIA